MANKNLFLQSPDAGDIEEIFAQGTEALASAVPAPAPAPAPVVAPVQRAPRTGNVEAFVAQYQPLAERVGQRLGVAPEALLGQWGLETGWGKSVIPGTNNLGNIKDFSGRGGVQAVDNMTGSRDAYRQYESPDAFADDFAGLLSRRYKSALGAGGDATRYFDALKQNGYAEDPHYVAKGTRAAALAASAMKPGAGKKNVAAQGINPPGLQQQLDAQEPGRYQVLSEAEAEAMQRKSLQSTLDSEEAGRYEVLTPDRLAGMSNLSMPQSMQPAAPQAESGALADFGKMGLGGVYKGIGQMIGGVGQAVQTLGDYTTTPIVNALTGSNYRTGNLLEKPASWYKGQGEGVQGGVSAESKSAILESSPGGDLFKPSTWTFGKAPSLRGYAMLGADVLGSMAPVVAATVATGGSATAAAVAGGAQGGGAAADKARETIVKMEKDGSLADQSAYYRELIAQGVDSKQAALMTQDAAANWAFILTTPVSAAGGALTSKIINPAEQIAARANLPGRVAARAGLGGLEEGAQETAETIQTQGGTNIGAGTNESLTDGTFGDFVLGALGGGTTGAAGGALSKRETSANPAPAQPKARKEPGLVVDIVGVPSEPAATPAPSGPIGRAMEKAAPAKPAPAPESAPAATAAPELPRVRITAENGQTMTGFAEQIGPNGSGRVLGDDGQVYQFTPEDGVTIEQIAAESEAPSTQQPEEAVAQEAQAQEEQAPAATETEAPAAEQQTAADDTGKAAPEATDGADAMYQQAVELVQKSRRASISLVQRDLRIGYNRAASLLERMEADGLVSPMKTDGSRTINATEQAAKAAPAPVPAREAAAERQLTEWSEQELRDRLRYVSQQAKLNGWDKRLLQMRGLVSREINSRKGLSNDANQPSASQANDGQAGNQVSAQVAATEQAGEASAARNDVQQPVDANAGERGAKAVSNADQPADAKPALTSQPDAHAGKWFGSQEKADAYLAKKKAGTTHEVVQTGKVRFEIKPKAQEEVAQFDKDSGTLGIPRAEMPQVPTEAHGGMVRHLNAQGIEHETKMVNAAALKPTQAEYIPAKVEAAKEAEGDRSVIVSNDGHIIDGHHQVLAAQEQGKEVKAIVLDAPVNEALDAVKKSPSATTDTATTDADLDAMFDQAVAAKKQADAQATPKTITEKLKESIARQGEEAANAPPVYTVKGIDAGMDWRDGAKRAPEHPEYKPTPRQQAMIDAVVEGEKQRIVYNSDMIEFVAKRLGLTADDLAQNTSGVQGGDVGMDVYYARQYVTAQEGHAARKKAETEMALQVGDKLGVLRFNDFKYTSATEVVGVSAGNVRIRGKRGAQTVELTAEPFSVAAAMDRAKEGGKRKEGYAEWVAKKQADAKAAPAVKAKTSAKPKAAPTARKEPRQGAVGMQLEAGEQVRTSSGRETTPFPKIDTASKGKTTNTLKRVDQWLMQNALDEATARGDDFNARQFEANKDKPSPADKDSAEEYLFGEQSAVAPSILRPLGSAAKNTAAGLTAAIDGLVELFGGAGKFNSGLAFDEETYAKAKPLFKQAIAHLSEAGRDLQKVMQAVVNMVMDKGGEEVTQRMRPYVVQFVKDVRDGKEQAVTAEKETEIDGGTSAGIDFSDEVTGAYSGQTNHTLTAAVDGKTVGTLEYTIYEGEPAISMVSVPESQRRKGYGAELVMQLQRAFPGTEIQWGGMTDDGAALRKSLEFKSVPSEYADKFDRLEKAQQERDALLAKADDFQKIDSPTEDQRNAYHEAIAPLNHLHDEIDDLQSELSGEKPSKQVIVGRKREKAEDTQAGDLNARIESLSGRVQGISMEPAAVSGVDAIRWNVLDDKGEKIGKTQVTRASVDDATIINLMEKTRADTLNQQARMNKPKAAPDEAVKGVGNDRQPNAGAADQSNAGQGTAAVRADEGSGDAERVPAQSAGPDAGSNRGSAPKRNKRGGDGGQLEFSVEPAGSNAADQQRPKGGRGSGNSAGDGADRGAASRVGNDYRINPEELKRTGSWKTTAEQNLRIVELVKQLEKEGRRPTAEEAALLTKFTGWGASEIANGVFPDRYGRYKPGWEELGQRLKAALTEEEYAQASRTTQYAHYTSPQVIGSIYDGMRRLGFGGGKIAEPGMGIGLFKGLMPASMAANSQYTGVEFDGITGAIAKLLYPESNIIVGDFTKTGMPRDFFDAAIGNPPFSSTVITNDPEYKKQGFMLHDYFFAKTIDRVKPGGLLVFVTSKGTMDKGTDRARKYLGERANLLGAIRLPQTAFKENAGTEVVTDVIFLQKRGDGIPDNGVKWMGTAEVTTPQGPANINEYFAAHPEMVLGAHALTGSMYRANEYTVLPEPGADMDAAFAKAIQNLPEGVYQPGAKNPAASAAVAMERDFNPNHKKEGGLYVSDKGALMQVDNGSGVELVNRRGADGKQIALKPADKAFLKDWTGLRDALKQAQLDQLTDGDWEKSLKALGKAYDGFVKKNGNLLAYSAIERTAEDGSVTVTKRFKNDPLLRLDTEGALAYSLEHIKEDGTIVKAPVLTGRVLEKKRPPEIKTTQDALFVSLNELGALDLDDVAKRAGTSRAEAVEALGTAIYEDPGNGWQPADAYLSGNVVRKLKEAQAAARSDKRYQRNIDALLAVQPKPLGPTEITVKLGQNWIPAKDIEAFATESLGEKIEVSYNPRLGSWTAEQSGSNYTEFNTPKMDAGKIMDAVLNNRQIKLTFKDGEGKTHVDAEATEKANDVAKKMREQFARWIWTDAKRADRLTNYYNEHFNNIAPRQFDGSHLTLPGVSLRFNLYPHQKRAIWRMIQEGDTYLAHSVGAGKTFTMIAAGMEERRLGLSNKPMYVVPNHMLAQFAREFLELYPAANIMVADEQNFHTHNRRRFVAQAALNNPDAIIITHSAFGRIGMSDEYASQFISDQIDEWKMALDETDKGDRITRKQIERRIEQLERRLEARQGKEKKDAVLAFEELGVDRLFVDEAHEFRKLDFATNQGNIKGIDPAGSQRAMDLFMKVGYLRGKKPGRALVAASGTPITNTMGELFTVQRMFQPDQLAEDGLDTFDSWANQYGDVAAGFEQNAAGGYEVVSRFAKFQNVPELMRRVRSFMDILTSANLGELVQRPAVLGGGREIVVTPEPDGYRAFQKTLETRISAIRSRKGPPKKGDDIILKVISDGRFSAIDMRFVDPSLPSDPKSKLNQAIDGMIDAYHKTADFEYMGKDGKPDALKGASIILFTDIGLGEQSAESRGFDMKGWIEKRLTEAGVPRDHIAFMRDHKEHAKKERLFSDMREGKKRILIGGKDMETGVNVQKRLEYLAHLDAPWFPASVEQREGRIVRQGNQNKQVRVQAFATKGSYDSTMWGMNGRKARFIEQAMNGDYSVRTMEDVSEASAFEMASALASGDERYMKLAGLKSDIDRMERLRYAHYDDQNKLRRDKHWAETQIDRDQEFVQKLEAAISKRVPIRAGEFAAKVGKTSYDSRDEFSSAIFNKTKELAAANFDGEEQIGEIGGFPITYYGIEGKGSGSYGASVEVGIPGDPSPLLTVPMDADTAVNGLATRAANQVNGLDRMKIEAADRIQTNKKRAEQIGQRLGAPFAEEAVLMEKVAELNALEAELTAEKAKEDGEPVSADAAAATVEAEEATAADDEPKFSMAAAAPNSLRSSLTAGSLGGLVQRLMDAGSVVLHDTAASLPVANPPAGTQALTMQDGTIHLVGDMLTRQTAMPVMLHEAFHSGGKKLLGTEQWNALLKRLAQIQLQAERSGGRAREFYDAARRSVVNASRTHAMSPKMMAEEFGAYTIEHYAQAPAAFQKWADDLIGAVKAWLLRRFGLQAGAVTPAQLKSLAVAALRDGVGSQDAPRYSISEDAKAKALDEADKSLSEASQEDRVGRVVNDIGLGARLLVHPRTIAAIHPEFTPVYNTAISQMETRDKTIAELGRGVESYNALTTEQKASVNKVLELGRLLSKTYAAEEVAQGVVNTGKKQFVRLNENGKPVVVSQPVKALLTEVGEVVELSPEEAKAYTDLRGMFDKALDMFRDQTLEEFGFPELAGHTQKAGRPLDIVDNGDGTFRLVGTTADMKITRMVGDEEKVVSAARMIHNMGGVLDEEHGGFIFDNAQREAVEEAFSKELSKSIARQLEELIQPHTPADQVERIKNIANFIREIEQAKRTGYVPFARYGDYVVTVKEKIADLEFEKDGDDAYIVRGVPPELEADMLELAALPDGDTWIVPKRNRAAVARLGERTVYSAKVETGLQDFIEQKKGAQKVDDLPSVKAAIEHARKEWVDGNPKRQIVAFRVSDKQPDAPVRLTDVDALAEIANIDNVTWDAVRDKLATAIQGRSFRKHFFHSDNVPGYTGDFERSVADYVIGMAGYLSRRKHQKRWDNAVDKISEKGKLHQYATRYRQYVNDPQEEYAAIRQIGFFSYIAGVMATAFANLTQVPLLTVPTLAQVAPAPLVVKETARAYKDALAMLSRKQGLDLFDPKKAPEDVRAAVMEAWDEGSFVPLETFDMMMMARQRNVGRRKLVKGFNDATKLVSIAFTFAERLNRLTTFMAAARLAAKEGVRKNADARLTNDRLARATVLGRNWTPKNFAEWVVDESQYRMGKANRPTAMRGIGSPIMQFKGFMLQTFEAWYRMAALHGQDGKYAAAASLVALYAMAGFWGMPGADDLRKLIEAAYKAITSKDLDLKTELRGWVARTSGSNTVAQIVNKGVTYPLGVDLTRVGMGSVAPDSALHAAGIPFDLLVGRPTRAFQKASAGDAAGAVAEFAPNFLKHWIVAGGWKVDGVRDKTGQRIIGPEQLTTGDLLVKGMGFSPSVVTDVRDYEYAQRRQETAVDGLKRQFASQIARTLVAMERAEADGDTKKLAKLETELDEAYAKLDEHNTEADAAGQIKIDMRSIRQRMARERGGVMQSWGRERKSAREGAEELRDLFGLGAEGDAGD